jgi:hypothetical protein
MVNSFVLYIIVSEKDSDGNPSDFVLPPEAQAQWRGLFGWGWYRFNLYRITDWSLSDIWSLSF